MPNFYNPEHCRNEKEVETKFIVYYLLPALGYPPESWFQEVTLGRFRLDFLVLTQGELQGHAPYQLVLEAKSPSQNLDRHIRKFKRYLSSFNACYGLLTNGKLVRIYESIGGEFKLVFEVAGRDLENKIDQVRQMIGREARVNASK